MHAQWQPLVIKVKLFLVVFFKWKATMYQLTENNFKNTDPILCNMVHACEKVLVGGWGDGSEGKHWVEYSKPQNIYQKLGMVTCICNPSSM